MTAFESRVGSRVGRPRAHHAGAAVMADELAESLTEGLVVLSALGRVLQANAAAHRMLAVLEPGDLVGMDGAELLDTALTSDGRTSGQDRNPVRQALASALPATARLGLTRPDGSCAWVDVRVVPLSSLTSAATVDPARRMVDAIGMVLSPVGTDEAGLAALYRQHQRIGRAHRMARLSMWQWDAGSGLIEWLDPAVDGTDDAAVGSSSVSRPADRELLHPDDRPTYDATLRALLTTPGSAELDLRYRFEDGWRHWLVWAESAGDEYGKITSLWGTAQEVTERREAEVAVRRLGMTDSLTELPNRAQVFERIAAALAEGRTTTGVGLVLFDVDRFSAVNDRFGPSVADQLLIEIGRRLRRLDDDHSSHGRVGPDQFALVIDPGDPTRVHALSSRAQSELSRPYRLAGAPHPVTVTVSVGTVLSSRDAPQATSELFRQGEIAVSFAKAAGGGRIVVFDEVLRAEALGRMNMEGRLRSALDVGAVFPLYQPIHTIGRALHADRVTGCEALARLDGSGTLIPPADFIGVAEESGLIVDLDIAVFAKAVRQVLDNPVTGHLALSVNFSPISLQTRDLVDRVAAVLSGAGLDGAALRVEITESSLAEPTPMLTGNLGGLRDLGARVGLDDFGTGYSALAYLSRFDLDFLKIDRSFVAGVCSTPRSRAVVRAVIDLAHAHDLHVVAEGVESADQLEALREMRCDQAQGFYLGRPMTIDALRSAARS